MHMRLTSSAFENQGNIPPQYTCDGENTNPPLRIEAVPETAVSLALIMDDPDVPKDRRPDGLAIHWLLWNIDPHTQDIAHNSVPQGATQGVNTRGDNQYMGPCPPDREHRYFFKLYALDQQLDLPKTADKNQLEKAIEGHIIEECQLLGRYERKEK
jgi:Raf kinase inhibitor-like YbhB/YbcL family protein